MLVLLCGRYRIFGHGRLTETSWATLGDEHFRPTADWMERGRQIANHSEPIIHLAYSLVPRFTCTALLFV